MSEKAVLAYSGGLDTSVAIKWIEERYGFQVIAVAIDLGAKRDYPSIQQRARDAGAVKSEAIDAKEEFVKDYVFPALQANALYEGEYPLATALARPLIAKLIVEVAHREGASAIAHGCTGKGNDQVRFEVSIGTLDPNLKVIAPAREWGMSREEEISYAQKHGIPVPVTLGNPYSIDENLWGKSIECGVLEDPWTEPPEDIYELTDSPSNASDDPLYIDIAFEKGLPTAIDNSEMDGVSLIERLNEVAGRCGVGRIDHLENRVVGIKSREIYEAPAAVVLIKAHRALEDMVLSRNQLRFKERVSQEYADLIYDGFWFSSLREDLAAFVTSSQRFVTGTVKMKLHKGNCMAVGRKSKYSLYNISLATYGEGDVFDQSAAPGFINIWGLSSRMQRRGQMI